jgi:hypothetical protein
MFCNLRYCMTLQVVSWWGPTWRAGSHDTQGVNTDAVLGLVLAEAAQQQQLKVAIHMEPYEGNSTSSLEKGGGSSSAMVTAAKSCVGGCSSTVVLQRYCQQHHQQRMIVDLCSQQLAVGLCCWTHTRTLCTQRSLSTLRQPLSTAAFSTGLHRLL